MAEWFYGYADKKGLHILDRDPENITVELFYDENVKSEISDQKTVEFWKLVNRAFENKESLGVFFRVLLDSKKEMEEIQGVMEKNPKDALVLLDERATGVELNTNGTTRETAESYWNIITGRTQLALTESASS
jgi:hypothetical protein